MHDRTAPWASEGPGTVPPGPAVGAVAGLVAAAVALGAGELVSAAADPGGPSLVRAVGSSFIDRFAASLKDLAVALFGTNDKAALLVGIVVVSLAVGAVLGVAAVRRPWVAAVGFGAFGLVGALAVRADELGSTGAGVLASAVAAVAGVGTLYGLLWLAGAAPVVPRRRTVTPVPPDARTGPSPDLELERTERSRSGPGPDARGPGGLVARRAFLGTAAVLGAGAAGLAVFGRRLAGRGASEAARAQVVLPPPVSSQPPPAEPLQVRGITPFVTPNDDFYRIDTALTIPQVDLDSWRLEVRGMVDRPFSLTHAELLAMESVEQTVTIACVSNEVGGDLVGNAVWQGVPLSALLERAGVQDGAGQVVGRSLDGWTGGFPTGLAGDGRPALVAYAMNGEPLPVRHGFPARLVVGGLYGYVSATKWLSAIELTPWDDVDGYWIPRGWAKEGPIKTQSRIDVPRSRRALAPGPTPIAGVAWAPTRGISKVEVRVDDGPWQECRLGDSDGPDTWVQWMLAWDATPGEHVITVRATDGDGRTQTADTAPVAPDGATGHHRRRVEVRPA